MSNDDQIAVSQELFELMQAAIEWALRKVQGEEGFSAVMVSLHPGGRKGSKYTFDSVEEALARSREDLRTDLRDATAYAIAYDAWYVTGDLKQPIIICRLEDARMPEAHEFFLPYNIQTKGGAGTLTASGNPQYLRKCDTKVLAQ